MSFWNTFEKSSVKAPKQEFTRPTDVLEMLDKDSALSADKHTPARFIGPIFGINTINVPIIRDNRFFRKKETSRLIAIPKQSLSYDYASKQMDVSKCPYLQYVTLENESILVATINYVKETDIKDKDILLKVLEQDGLRAAFWDNQDTRKILLDCRELSDILTPIAKRGVREYYTNVVLFPDDQPLTQAMINTYVDMTVRTPAEQTPQSYLDYSTTYNLPVYLKDSKTSAAPTPVKVLKMSESVLRNLFEEVVKLNTVYINKETKEKEFKGVEDPEFGCEVLLRLKELSFRGATGKKMYSIVCSRGERIPLTESERKYLLWDLTKLKSHETYDQAFTFLNDMGYCKGAVAATPKVETVSQPVVTQPQVVPAVAPVQAPMQVPVAPVQSTIPESAVDALPWAPPAQAEEKPVKPMVKATAADDFDSVFA